MDDISINIIGAYYDFKISLNDKTFLLTQMDGLWTIKSEEEDYKVIESYRSKSTIKAITRAIEFLLTKGKE